MVDEILALRCMEQENPLSDVLTEEVAELMCDSSDFATIKDIHASAALKLFALVWSLGRSVVHVVVI